MAANPSPLLDPEGARAEPRRDPEPRRATCEFCGCKLTPKGEILEMSDKAREYRDIKETVQRAEATIAELRKEVAALKTPEPSAVPSRGRTLVDFGV